MTGLFILFLYIASTVFFFEFFGKIIFGEVVDDKWWIDRLIGVAMVVLWPVTLTLALIILDDENLEDLGKKK